MEMAFWGSEDDVINDMLTMSEFTDAKKFVPSKKPSEFVKKLRGKSMFDTSESEGEEDEAVAAKIREETRKKEIISRGRGYVAAKYMDSAVGDPAIQQATLSDIREIYPLGHSNELIEAMYNGHSQKTKTSKRIEQLRFRPSSSSSSSSNTVQLARSLKEDETMSNGSVSSLPPDFIEYDIKTKQILDYENSFPPLGN